MYILVGKKKPKIWILKKKVETELSNEGLTERTDWRGRIYSLFTTLRQNEHNI